MKLEGRMFLFISKWFKAPANGAEIGNAIKLQGAVIGKLGERSTCRAAWHPSNTHRDSKHFKQVHLYFLKKEK